jgi:hypothetical protein
MYVQQFGLVKQAEANGTSFHKTRDVRPIVYQLPLLCADCINMCRQNESFKVAIAGIVVFVPQCVPPVSRIVIDYGY